MVKPSSTPHSYFVTATTTTTTPLCFVVAVAYALLELATKNCGLLQPEVVNDVKRWQC